MSNNPTLHSSQHNESSTATARQKVAANWLRIVGSAEGTSFLLLLFVAMPMKYIGNNPEPVRWLGSIHGGLFLLYVACVLGVARILNWRWVHVVLGVLASVVPFGPFIFDAWLRREAGRNNVA